MEIDRRAENYHQVSSAFARLAALTLASKPTTGLEETVDDLSAGLFTLLQGDLDGMWNWDAEKRHALCKRINKLHGEAKGLVDRLEASTSARVDEAKQVICQAADRGIAVVQEALDDAKRAIHDETRRSVNSIALHVASATRQTPTLVELVQTVSSLHSMVPAPPSDHASFALQSIRNAQADLEQKFRQLELESGTLGSCAPAVPSGVSEQNVQSMIDAALAKQEALHQQAMRDMCAELSQSKGECKKMQLRLDSLEGANASHRSSLEQALAQQEERQLGSLKVIRHDVLDVNHAFLEFKASLLPYLELFGTDIKDNVPPTPDLDGSTLVSDTKAHHLFIPTPASPYADEPSAMGEFGDPVDSEGISQPIAIESSDFDDTESTISAISDDSFYVMEPSKTQVTASSVEPATKTSPASSTQSSTFDNTGALAVSPSQLSRLMRAALLLNVTDGQALLAHLDRPAVTRDFMPFDSFLAEYYKLITGGKRRGKSPRQDAIWRQLRAVMHEPMKAGIPHGEGRPPLWEGCGPQGIGQDRK